MIRFDLATHAAPCAFAHRPGHRSLQTLHARPSGRLRQSRRKSQLCVGCDRANQEMLGSISTMFALKNHSSMPAFSRVNQRKAQLLSQLLFCMWRQEQIVSRRQKEPTLLYAATFWSLSQNGCAHIQEQHFLGAFLEHLVLRVLTDGNRGESDRVDTSDGLRKRRIA